MRADRGVHAAGDQRVLQHLAVHALAHAVQPLQFKRRAALGAHLQNGRDGGRVVRGELRVDRVGRGQQRVGTGQVRHIGVVLVREDGVVRKTHLLRALDLGVPIRAFDQAAHQANFVFAGDVGDVFDQLQRTRLVSLHGQTKAGPLREMQRHFGGECFKNLQRQFEAVHLFRVNREVDVGFGRLLAQAPHAGHQLGHHAGDLRVFITGVQRAEFDGNAIILLTSPRRLCVGSYGLNSILVAGQIFERIRIGARALAQHVVAVAQVFDLAFGRCSLAHRFTNRLAQHKLAAQQLHGAQGCGHHGAGAELGEDACGRFAVGQKLLAHRNGGAGEARQRFVTCRIKVRAAQLVGGESNGRFGIGHA